MLNSVVEEVGKIIDKYYIINEYIDHDKNFITIVMSEIEECYWRMREYSNDISNNFNKSLEIYDILLKFHIERDKFYKILSLKLINIYSAKIIGI